MSGPDCTQGLHEQLCKAIETDITLSGTFVQVLTVFFGSFIAGSFLNQLTSIIHDPTTIVEILGDAAPQVAVFFMTYLLLMVRSMPCLTSVTQNLHRALAEESSVLSSVALVPYILPEYPDSAKQDNSRVPLDIHGLCNKALSVGSSDIYRKGVAYATCKS